MFLMPADIQETPHVKIGCETQHLLNNISWL